MAVKVISEENIVYYKTIPKKDFNSNIFLIGGYPGLIYNA